MKITFILLGIFAVMAFCYRDMMNKPTKTTKVKSPVEKKAQVKTSKLKMIKRTEKRKIQGKDAPYFSVKSTGSKVHSFTYHGDFTPIMIRGLPTHYPETTLFYDKDSILVKIFVKTFYDCDIDYTFKLSNTGKVISIAKTISNLSYTDKITTQPILTEDGKEDRREFLKDYLIPVEDAIQKTKEVMRKEGYLK